MTAPPGPLAWVSWLRVVAVLGVVMIHTVGATASGPGSTTTVDGWVARALDLPFLWAVPVFVMLSGALSLDPERYRGSGAYLRRRAWRLVPGLVVWHVVYVAYLSLTREGWWQGLGPVLARVVQGQVAPHLYFFWIVLGLSLLTPLLVPWVARSGRREWVVAALAAYAVPVLSTWPLGSDGARVGLSHAAWSWWLPYLGAYLMGWALRGVTLPRRSVVPALGLAVGLSALLTWQWRNEDAPGWLEQWSGAHYYSLTVAVLSVLVLLLAQTLLRPDGALRALTRPSLLRAVDAVAGASMGIFAMHYLVLLVGIDTGWLGEPVSTWPVLLVRFAVVSVVTTALVLVLRRVPVVRQVL
ncbi:acyltransferase [Ornithinimicrobium cerasi]|uniref:acyltransferase n=1 Tax=Ornithinimicrobium cerasi TaxID=2248773 RepID=UPI000EFEC7D3|nr:acyltransferase [Ornithinimicrobium cerasi]